MAAELELTRQPTGDGGDAPRTPRISLLIYHRENTQVVALGAGRPLVIGRVPTAEVPIPDESLSRVHARFEVIDGEVYVEDLGSTNGTKLNGERITRSRLRVGDEVTMGSVTASIHVLPPLPARRDGVGSHDRFLVELETEITRARTFGRPAALLMLRAVGAAQQGKPLRSCLRPVDRLACYSEEILEVLLPEASEEEASRVLQSLMVTVQAPPGGATAALAVYPGAGTSADKLLAVCASALRQATAAQPVQVAPSARGGSGPVVGAGESGPVARSEAMRRILENVQRLATASIPVLLFGETGTGKEVLARLIHEAGPRKGRRLASINCGAIPSTLVESALFGHEKGAFTGASQASRGLFEEADGGTVLLDEVAELSLAAQAALLRSLETKRITRVGSSREIAVDVRIIAATNRDLEAMSAEGRFRTDLLYRLNAMTIEIPPLRQRPEEIAPLVERFVQQANEANGRQVVGLEAEAMRLLHQYSWPGNVRELRNAVERAVVIARDALIVIDDLPRRVREFAAQTLRDGLDERALAGPLPEDTRPEENAAADDESVTTIPGQASDADYKSQLQHFEVQIILEALRRAGWNRTEAARQLNIPVRTLSYKIRQLGIKKMGFAVEE